MNQDLIAKTAKSFVSSIIPPIIKNFIYNLIDIKLVLSTWRYELHQCAKYDFLKEKTVGESRSSSLTKSVSIIIPIRGEDNTPRHLRQKELRDLKKLLCHYLPEQTHKNYEAIVYCDGPNKKVEQFINNLKDSRFKVYALKKQTGLWGNPQTQQGAFIAKGDYFVRMDCDNHPYHEYLNSLIAAFDDKVGIVYGRIVVKRKSRRYYRKFFIDKVGGISNEMEAFILPRDMQGAIKVTNIDFMNYMVRTELARKYVDAFCGYAADYCFAERLLKEGIKFKFIDKLIGAKL